MRAAIDARAQQAVLVTLVPFVFLHIADGIWKPHLLKGPTIHFWAYDLFAWVVVPVLTLTALHKFSPIRPDDYGLRAPLGWADIAFLLPLPLIAMVLANVVAALIASIAFGYAKPAFSYIPALDALGGLWILGTIYLSATAGLWESIFYIGLPWLLVARSLRSSPTVRRTFAVVSAIVFATAHHENGPAAMVGVFVFQLVAVRWFFKLGTLWPIIGAHVVVDVYYFGPWAWVKP